ncbi:MAG: matrixin family metalloprotease [Proteobacteria bacterium]|nr:matrixin family metalloprotease [Pseudomonadota bacterium]
MGQMNRKLLNKTSRLACVCFIVFTTTAFVPIFSNKAILPSTVDDPEVVFVWDGALPRISDKDSYKDGIYSQLSDRELMLALLDESAAIWSNVAGSYLKLKIEENPGLAKFDPKDKVNSIVLSNTGTLSAAATATPVLSENKSVIEDCDIILSEMGEKNIQSILIAMVHELGHCIGLGHAHDNLDSIMGYGRTYSSYKLGADDKAGAIYLYPDPAYGDTKVRQAVPVQCGNIGVFGSSSQWATLLIASLPFSLVFFRRRIRWK